MKDFPGVSSWITRNLDWSHVRQSEIDFRKVPWHGCGPWLSRNDNDGPLRQVETMMWFEMSNCIYAIGENQPLPPETSIEVGKKDDGTGWINLCMCQNKKDNYDPEHPYILQLHLPFKKMIYGTPPPKKNLHFCIFYWYVQCFWHIWGPFFLGIFWMIFEVVFTNVYKRYGSIAADLDPRSKILGKLLGSKVWIQDPRF